MLVGKRAFDGGTTVEAMNAILKEDPPESTGTNRGVPPLLDRIVHHCLEKNPEERFSPRTDVAFALGAVLDSSKSAVAGVTVATSQPWRRWLRFAAEVALLGVAVACPYTPHFGNSRALQCRLQFFRRLGMDSGPTSRSQHRFRQTEDSLPLCNA